MNGRPLVPYEQNSLFVGVPAELIRSSQAKASELMLETGDVIFEESDVPDYFYLVESGAVRITKALPAGRHESIALVGAGEFFGELALYDGSSRSARAAAASPTRLYRLSKEDLDHLRKAAPLEIASNLADASIRRVRLTNTRLVDGLAAAGRLADVGADISILWHNMRGQVATIRQAADLVSTLLAEEGGATSQTLRFVEMIGTATDKVLVQIDSLMRRLKGEEDEAFVTIRTSELLQDLRDSTLGFLLNPAIRYSDENCTYTGEVTVDRLELGAVLTNLVKNSVEALPAEGGEISVNVALEGASVVFSVSDTGSGIKPEYLSMVFERDFSHGKNGGSGIGLSHARDVAEKHGGRIYVESEVGLGTTVRVKIPRYGSAGGSGSSSR